MTLALYREVKQFEPSANTDPALLSAYRKNAYESIQKNGFPSRKQEGWKYLNLEPILSNVFAENTKADELELKDIQLENAYQVVVQNGKINKELSSSDLPQNLVVCDFEDAFKNHRSELEACINLAQAETLNSFEALNRVRFQDALFCLLQKETKLDKPLHILILNSNTEIDAVFYPHIYVLANEGSKANILTRKKTEAVDVCAS